MGGKKTSVQHVRKISRAAEAVRLRREGYSIAEIRSELGYATNAKVASDIRGVLRAVEREASEDVLQLELERLDALWRPVFAKATNGDEKGFLFAVDRALTIMDRRAKYLGLDAQHRAEDYSEVDQWLAGVGDVDYTFDPTEIGIDEDGNELDEEVPDEVE